MASVRLPPNPMNTHRTPPWKKQADRPAGSTKLTPASVAWARARAREAGRRYPNLIDNMAASRRQREQEHERLYPHGLRGARSGPADPAAGSPLAWPPEES